jgi:hypothetical protein
MVELESHTKPTKPVNLSGVTLQASKYWKMGGYQWRLRDV